MDTSKRLSTLRSKMQAKNIDFCLVMEPDNQYYLSDFKAITYSRPIFTLIDHGRTELIIPALEEYHAAEEARIDHIHIYYEDYARPGRFRLKMLDGPGSFPGQNNWHRNGYYACFPFQAP